MFTIQEPALTIDDNGLMLRACQLAKRQGDTLQADPAALAILARPEQTARVEKAIATWNRGEHALALIMLVHMGEPVIKTEAQVRAELAKAGFDPGQPRDDDGKWTDEGTGAGSDADTVPRISIAQTLPDTSGPEITIHPNPPAASLSDVGSAVLHGLNEAFGVPSAEAQTEEEPKEEAGQRDENKPFSLDELSNDELDRETQFQAAEAVLRKLGPNNPALQSISYPGYVPTQEQIDSLWAASRATLGLPADWHDIITDKFDGREYVNPGSDNDRVRLMGGNPNAKYMSGQEPYVKDQIDGRFLTTQRHSPTKWETSGSSHTCGYIRV